MFEEHYLYRFPEIYYEIHYPEDYFIEFLESIIRSKFSKERCAILDTTCGPGNMIDPFKYKYEIHGNDIDPVMLMYCKKMIGDMVKTHNFDMSEMDKINKKFHVIFNLENSILHAGDYDRVLHHLIISHKLIEKGGLYLLSLSTLVENRVPNIEYQIPSENGVYGIKYESISGFNNTLRVKITMRELVDNQEVLFLSYYCDMLFFSREEIIRLVNDLRKIYSIYRAYEFQESYILLDNLNDFKENIFLVLEKK